MCGCLSTSTTERKLHCQKSAVSEKRQLRQARKQGHVRFSKWPAASTIAPFLSRRHKQQAHKTQNGTKQRYKKKRRHRNGSNKRDGNHSRASRRSVGEDTTRPETGSVPRNSFPETPQATAPAVGFQQVLVRHQRVRTQEPQVSGPSPSSFPSLDVVLLKPACPRSSVRGRGLAGT